MAQTKTQVEADAPASTTENALQKAQETDASPSRVGHVRSHRPPPMKGAAVMRAVDTVSLTRTGGPRRAQLALALQRSVGNARMAQLLLDDGGEGTASPYTGGATTQRMERHRRQNGRRQNLPPEAEAPADLNTGEANDAFEQEANGVAASVQRLCAKSGRQLQPRREESKPAVQAKCASSEEHAEGAPGTQQGAAGKDIQTSLNIGEPDDAFEREADEVAGTVQRQAASHSAKPPIQPKPASAPPIQRVCDECATEQRRRKNDAPAVQRQGDAGTTARVDADVARTIESPDAGTQVPERVKSQVEPALGADLGEVRVHNNTKAVDAARQLNAKAFTHQQDIYLGENQSADDLGLMAHELTHTVQQRDSAGGQPALIQRQGECEEGEREGGSEEQAREAESAPPVSDCAQTNPPVEQPPEDAEEPEEDESPADIDANEGASVEERQSNAPPPDDNAPEGEEDLSESGEEGEAAPQDPCAVRESVGAAGREGGAGTAPPEATGIAGTEAPSAAAGPGPAEGAAAAGEGAGGGEDAGDENGFLTQAIAAASGNQQPEGRGEAASPDVAAERDTLSVSADEAQAALAASATEAGAIAAAGVSFIQPDGQAEGAEQMLANHQATSGMANDFLGRAGKRLNDFIQHATIVTQGLRADTEQKKAALTAQIQQRRDTTRGLIAQLRAEAQGQAQVATAAVEAKHAETLGAIDARAQEAQAQLDALYPQQQRRLEQARSDQTSRLDTLYQTGHRRLLQIGQDKGGQAMTRAREHERGYRRADGASDVIQQRVQNREKDGFWDGYLSYNRYMARADAAVEVGEQYRDGFQEQAQAQADNMLCGKARDEALTTAIGEQGLQSLECARDNAIDAIENQRRSAIEMANQARQRSLATIRTSLRATEVQLDEREAGQLQLLHDYGVRQALAIERDSERAVGAVLQGANDAAVQILQYLGQFSDQIQGGEAPEADIFAAQLATEEAQLSASFDGAQATFNQAFEQSRSSLNTANQQALGAIDALYMQGIDGARELAAAFTQAMADLTEGALSGYDQTLAAYDERITGELDNSSQILTGVVDGVLSVFERINAGIEGKFQQAGEQMQQGMQSALDEDLDQKICAEAEKAAADVQPWWKTVLKILLIIVVIVVVALVLGPAIIGAVGAAATALAGSLGAGAALAGAIGAWVGPIIGGAIVGAIAGAAIQLGSNALYNKPLTEGLWQAVIAGAIGGALGGLGGQLGQVLVGRFATTALSRIVIQYGTDAFFDVAGGILGDLAAGREITLESVLMGLAIGGAVQLSMGGIGGMARARAAGAAGEAPTGVTGRLAQGRLGRAAERITDLQGRAMAAGERFGARLGGVGPRAPTVAGTREALAGARARMTEEGEFLPTRGEEPEGFRGRPETEAPGRIEAGEDVAPRTREFSDSTDVNNPRVRQELDDLEPMTPETRQLLADNPRLRRTLLENPLAARALKKCASPCFPTNMDPADVSRLNEFLNSHPDIDPSRLVDYLYAHRDTPGRLTDAVDRLVDAPDPKAFIDNVDLPNRVTSADLDDAVVARLEAQGFDKEVFDDLLAMGYPSDVLEGALRNFRGLRSEGDFESVIDFLSSFGTGGKPRALVQALENIHSGNPADSDFLSRVASQYREPSLRPVDVDGLRARFDAGDALLAKGDIDSPVEIKPHEIMLGYIMQTSSNAKPAKALRGSIDFVILGEGGPFIIGQKHSALSEGASAVYAAGEISFHKSGLIYEITNGSGHYLPSSANLDRAYRWLVSRGYLDQDIPVELIYVEP